MKKLDIYKSDNFKVTLPSSNIILKELESFERLLISLFISNGIDKEIKRVEMVGHDQGLLTVFQRLKMVDSKVHHDISFRVIFIFKNKHNVSEFSIRGQITKIIDTLYILHSIQELNK